jgi:hypothetical protein
MAYNAVTEYVDHVRPADAKTASARDKANISAIFGSGDALKARALAAAVATLQPAVSVTVPANVSATV